jgi:tyrosyl-tRNA synthetase
MEFGGDDQWSNMLAGTELIRKKLSKDAYALTITLLTNSEGKKMGKTVGGAVWLDPEKTTPYDFYQYWRNVADSDVIKCLKLLTFVPLEEIEEMAKWEGAELNKAKERLAYDLTEMVHGKEEADKADAAAKAIFMGGGDSANMPKYTLKEEDYRDGAIDICGVLFASGLSKSRSDARQNVQQGGVQVAGEKVTDVKKSYTAADFKDGVIVQRGKKNFVKIFS